MGFRFRKSIKIAPGIRFNVGTKSAGISFGGKGLRYSINSRRGSSFTASIPGTGISYTSSTSAGRKRRTHAYRRGSELNRLLREHEKMQELQRAKLEVEQFENHIEMIHSIHKECDDPIDWHELRSRRPPFEGPVGPNQLKATEELSRYVPGFFDKLFKRVEKKRAALEQRIKEAAREDEADYRSWKEVVALAEKVLSGDTEEYLRVIEEMKPLDDLAEFGSGFEFFVGDDPNVIVVEFEVHLGQVVPKEMKSLTKTGKCSVKEIPKTKYYDLEQDYVCSCVIRIALDLFALLPIEHVFVHAMDDRLNPSTGYMERMPILSVRIDKRTLKRLKLDTIDCSDAVQNFEHRMRFLKTGGFQPVSKLEV